LMAVGEGREEGERVLFPQAREGGRRKGEERGGEGRASIALEELKGGRKKAKTYVSKKRKKGKGTIADISTEIKRRGKVPFGPPGRERESWASRFWKERKRRRKDRHAKGEVLISAVGDDRKGKGKKGFFWGENWGREDLAISRRTSRGPFPPRRMHRFRFFKGWGGKVWKMRREVRVLWRTRGRRPTQALLKRGEIFAWFRKKKKREREVTTSKKVTGKKRNALRGRGKNDFLFDWGGGEERRAPQGKIVLLGLAEGGAGSRRGKKRVGRSHEGGKKGGYPAKQRSRQKRGRDSGEKDPPHLRRGGLRWGH